MKFISITRPHFRLYTLWPFLVWIAANDFLWNIQELLNFWLQDKDYKMIVGTFIIIAIFCVYIYFFAYPANLLIYGVNDIADKDTDAYNTKKDTYEQRFEQSQTIHIKKRILSSHTLIHICCIGLLFLFGINEWLFMKDLSLSPTRALSLSQSLLFTSLLFIWNIWVLMSFLLFYLTSVFYSLPPIRAKARPFLDWIFNVLYILPGCISFFMFGGHIHEIVRWTLGAWRLWCIAMHTYSAIPDIDADKKAGLSTTAIVLGKTWSLLYCWILWICASILLYISLPQLRFVASGWIVLYTTMLILAYRTSPMTIYRFFPWINGILWFVLFWAIMFLV